MKTNSLKQLKNGKVGDQLTIEFSSNRLLIDLCGEFDRNISQIELALSVDIVRKGNQLFVVGDAKEEAARVLKGFYLRLEEKKGLDSLDIEAELRTLIVMD